MKLRMLFVLCIATIFLFSIIPGAQAEQIIKATVVNPPNKIETIHIPHEECTWAEGGFSIKIENLIWQNVTINGFVFGNAIPNTQVIFPDLPFDLAANDGQPGGPDEITVRWRIRVHSSADPGVYEREFKVIWSYVDPITHELVSGSVTVDPTIILAKPVGGIVVPVDKFGLLAPYIGVASTILVATAATAIYVKHVKHRKEKQ